MSNYTLNQVHELPLAVMPYVPRVLVLLATYNGTIWIREQLESIVAQTNVQIKIRVSDDCSSDDTVSKILEFAKACPSLDIQVDRRQLRSGSAGSNFREMLRHANLTGADFVALADQDDVWSPDHLRIGADFLQKDKSQGYSCAVQLYSGEAGGKQLSQSSRIGRLDFLFEGAGQGCGFVISAQLAEKVRQVLNDHQDLTNRLHYHDWLIYLISRLSDYRWSFDSRVGLLYRQHDGNEIGGRASASAFWRRVELIRKGWYLSQVASALDLARAIDPQYPGLEYFSVLLHSPDTTRRRLLMCIHLLGNSRRKLIDSIALSLFALCGWI